MPDLLVNPRHDQVFESVAEGLSSRPGASPASLQAALRTSYPNAIVHARDLSGEPRAVWYVYRDGHWISGRDRIER